MSTKLIARDQCLAPERVGDSVYGGRYRRLFENLPALDSEDEALHALGSPGGICDDDADPSTDGEMAAGWPFFGQFVAHDITADRSLPAHQVDAITFERPNPTIDLESSTVTARPEHPTSTM